MKKSSKKSFRVSVIFCLLAMIAALTVGCGQDKQEENTKPVSDFIDHLFSDLSESEYEEAEEMTEENKTPKWIETRFKENMTDEAYSAFLETATYNIPVLAYSNDKELKLEELKIDEKEEQYDFSGRLIVCEEDEKSEETEITIKGSTQLNEEGLISSINIFNVDEIIAALK